VDTIKTFEGYEVWAPYRPANALGYEGPSFALGIAHANTGGISATGSLAVAGSGGTETAAGTIGVAYSDLNTAFGQIVTTLVQRNIIDVLRSKAVIMQGEDADSAFIRASHVQGTKDFRYPFFADLGAAEDLLEGVPPQGEALQWDILTFSGTQKGKLVPITDLAEMFSPFELYSIAAEKLAWNAVDTAESDISTLLMAATGIPVTLQATIAQNVVSTVVALKQAEVPRFSDGYYHALISPADAGDLMTELGALGWTEANKYGTNTMPLLNGEVGRFRGVRFVETNRVDDGKAVVHGPGYFIHGDFQTIRAYRVAPGGDHADPLAQRGLVGWKGMWGFKLLEFDGTPAAGPASNPEGYRFAVVNLTSLST
jgi:N4-gp56 family major capsid protein